MQDPVSNHEDRIGPCGSDTNKPIQVCPAGRSLSAPDNQPHARWSESCYLALAATCGLIVIAENITGIIIWIRRR